MAYRESNRGEPPIDVWAIHVYDLDWTRVPMVRGVISTKCRMQTTLQLGAMSLFDAQALSDDELARIAQEAGFDLATVNEVAESVRAHAAYDEQVSALVFTTGRPKDDVERLVRMVRTTVIEQR